MAKERLTENIAEQTPTGGVLVGKRNGQTMIHNKGSLSGYLVGKTHAEGGIKAVNEATGQPLEMQGGEVVITAPAVSDQTKREFQGKMLTNRQILSEINTRGGGVSFAEGGDVPKSLKYTGASYKFGGKTMSDHDILMHINKGHLAKGKTLKQIAKLHGVTLPDINKQVQMGLKIESEHTSSSREQLKIVKDHLIENPKYYTLLKKAGLENGGGLYNTDSFMNYSFNKVKDFLKSQNNINLKEDWTFVFKGEIFTILPPMILLDKDKEKSIKSAEFIIHDYEEIDVATIKFYPDKDDKKNMIATSNYFEWNDIKFDLGGQIHKKENLVKDSENGDTPARDLNNYNDVLDLGADGAVGGDNGLVFSNGGDLSEIDSYFDLGGNVGMPEVDSIRIKKVQNSIYSKLIGMEFPSYTALSNELFNIFIDNGKQSFSFVFTVNQDIKEMGLLCKNAKNTVLNFNPVTGGYKDFEKQIERRYPRSSKLYNWGEWIKGLKSTPSSVIATPQTSTQQASAFISNLNEIPDEITLKGSSITIGELPAMILALLMVRVSEQGIISKNTFNMHNKVATIYYDNGNYFNFDDAIEGFDFWKEISRGDFRLFKEKYGIYGEKVKDILPITSQASTSASTTNQTSISKEILDNIAKDNKVDRIIIFDSKSMTKDDLPLLKSLWRRREVREIANLTNGKGLDDFISFNFLNEHSKQISEEKAIFHGSIYKNLFVDEKTTKKDFFLSIFENFPELDFKNMLDDNFEVELYEDFKNNNKSSTPTQSNLLTDLSNTKIWIGDNPELSKRVQERAFELGWDWVVKTGGKKQVKLTDRLSLFFNNEKNIVANSSVNAFSDKFNFKEIFPDQLFGNTLSQSQTSSAKPKLGVVDGFHIEFKNTSTDSFETVEEHTISELLQKIVSISNDFDVDLIYIKLVVEGHVLYTTGSMLFPYKGKDRTSSLVKEINTDTITSEKLLYVLQEMYPDFDFSKVAEGIKLKSTQQSQTNIPLPTRQKVDSEFVADDFELRKNEILGSGSLEQDRKDLDALSKLLPAFQESKFAVEKASILKEMARINNKLAYKGFIASNEEVSKGADLFTPQGLLQYYYTQTTQNPTAELQPACELPTPNGAKSKLPMSAYLNVRSSQFKKWFGDWEKAYETGNYVNCSKMIDEETKEPKIFFHGVRKYIPSFGQMSNMGSGVVRPYGSFEPPNFPASYFANNEDYANFYGGIAENMPKPSPDYKPFIYKVFLCIKNPISLLPLDFEVSYRDLIDYVLVAYGVRLNVNQALLKQLENDIDKKHPMWVYIRRDIGLIETLKDYGYDALIQQGDIPVFDKNGEVVADRSKFIKDTEYLTFNPQQVKSATIKKSFYFNFFNDIRFKKGGYVRI